MTVPIPAPRGLMARFLDVIEKAGNRLPDPAALIALLMLDSAKGRQIEVEATGPQEEEALAAVIALFNAGFDED